MPRPLLAALIFALILMTAACPLRGADVASLRFEKDVRPLLETYCFACHGGEKVKGDVNFAPARSDYAIQADPKLWQHVLTQLSDQTMPPAGKPQPAMPQRQLLIDYITHRLDNLDLAKLPKDPGRVTLHRLNRNEYNNTIRDLLGVDTRPADTFPADGGGGGGFDNNADTLFVPPVLMEMYLKAAGEVLAATDSSRLITAKPEGGKSPRDAARQCIERFATRAFRRPATSAEVDRLLSIFDRAYEKFSRDPPALSAVEGKGSAPRDPFADSLKLACKAILVSPHFLFRVEHDQPTKDAYPINHFELATRLSYFIWSSMPDDELFKLAGEAKLHDDSVLDQQVRRMLKDPKSKALAEHFGGQWLGFVALRTTANPDRKKFPQFTPALRDAFYDEAVAFVDSVFRDDRTLLTLIDADYTFANEALAKHYALKTPEKVKGQELRRVTLGDKSRGGVLGLGAIHTVTSYPLRTSPVLRGKWVLETILGSPPPPPPPEAGKLPEDDTPVAGQSLRQQLEKHRRDANCASCHARMDPLGFALENFDAIGRWRDKDPSDKPVDSAGTLPTGETVTGPAELRAVLLKKKDAFTHTVAEKMLAYALGRGLEPYDRVPMKKITDEVAAGGYKSATLVSAIARSYPFRYRRNP
jgi:mono/diheme cytochrome c family protein